MGDGKDSKAKGASDRQVRAHIRRVLKQLLPKGGEKKPERKTCTDGATGVGSPARAATIGGG